MSRQTSLRIDDGRGARFWEETKGKHKIVFPNRNQPMTTTIVNSRCVFDPSGRRRGQQNSPLGKDANQRNDLEN